MDPIIIRRVVDNSNVFWFKLEDVVRFLDYANIDAQMQVIKKRESRENVIKFRSLQRPNVQQADNPYISLDDLMINEKSMIRWLMTTTMANAKQFKNWIVDNLLPYGATPLIERYLNSDVYRNNIEQDVLDFNTGYVFIISSDYYYNQKENLCLIRRSRTPQVYLTTTNCNIIDGHMKLELYVIWRSPSYKQHKRNLENRFDGFQENAYFRLDENQLDETERYMSELEGTVCTYRKNINRDQGAPGQANEDELPGDIDLDVEPDISDSE